MEREEFLGLESDPFRLMLPDEETTVFAAEHIPSLLRQT
jgi:hypothetical protein